MKKLFLAFTLLALTSVPGLALADSRLQDASINATTNAPVYTLDDKLVLGRVEDVYLNSIDELQQVPIVGKIDTGADTTSIHATNIHVTSNHAEFETLQDDALLQALVEHPDISTVEYDDWDGELFAPYQVTVSFDLSHPYDGEQVAVSLPLTRVGMIRNRTQTKPIIRPTVTLPMTIAGITVATEVNLTDRSQFSAPILIGKTFLEDNAWVFAGFDYLQQQQQALLIGKKEQVKVAGITQKLTYSLTNNYSVLNAANIKVDQSAQQVTFDINDPQGNTSTLTRPLVRMLNVSGEPRPMVYIPVSYPDKQRQYWLVYLSDRSKLSSQIRLGKETLNRHFMIDTGAESLLSGSGTRFNPKSKALQVSGQETLTLDGVTLSAEPSLFVKTPLLKVPSFEIYQDRGKDWVTYYLSTSEGDAKQFSKPINKKLKVGDTVRPVVFGTFVIHGQEVELPYAIDVLDKDQIDEHFIIGQNMSPDGVLINSRSDHLLDSYPLFKAGHIEVAQIDQLSFPVKLDTGADVTSINAQNIKLFKQAGQQMVSFDYHNDLGMQQTFTLPVVDTMTITAKAGEKPTVRPVVEMFVKLGKLEKKVRVNLQDRSRFHYSMILGKNFLQYGAVVSSDENYILTEKPAGEK
ncbi:RimK/LysX family protein [Vibrio sinaloensis]|uniref:putative ATP-dependent zinc protease n=1 Tax=Photobacterium sp. (strain ATCC 43367) TaxID=379097 RepID=UPI00206EC684|nr:RimK/LysX family protein [Vibrio sinaloensis]UPQ88061.1 RimK/LysX family protein [Vibrio sinaloensis]